MSHAYDDDDEAGLVANPDKPHAEHPFWTKAKLINVVLGLSGFVLGLILNLLV